MTAMLRQALVEMSEGVPPARVPSDLWQVGMRRRRSAAVAVSVLAMVVAVPLVGAALGRSSRPPADPGAPDGAVPARTYIPHEWQGTVQQAPNGPAAVLTSDSFAWDL